MLVFHFTVNPPVFTKCVKSWLVESVLIFYGIIEIYGRNSLLFLMCE